MASTTKLATEIGGKLVADPMDVADYGDYLHLGAPGKALLLESCGWKKAWDQFRRVGLIISRLPTAPLLKNQQLRWGPRSSFQQRQFLEWASFAI